MKRIFSSLTIFLVLISLFMLVSCDGGGSSSTVVSGKILLNDAGLPKVKISITTDEGDPETETVTGIDGSYKTNSLSGGTYTVTPTCKGYTFSPPEREIDIKSGNGGDNIDFTALYNEEELLSVSGKIYTEHYPLENVSITAVSSDTGLIYTTTSDGTGAYLVNHLTDGDYSFTVAKEGYTFAQAEKQITINGSDITETDFIAEFINIEEQIQIIMTGDINLGNRTHEVINDPAIGAGDYTYPFKKLVADEDEGFTPFLDISQADITIGNLESIITDEGKNTKSTLEEFGYGVALKADPKSVEGLVFAGFDILSLANNHTGDYGYEGLLDCMSLLENNGIEPLGAGNNYSEAHAPVIKDIKNTKIAFLGYTNVPMYADITGFSPTSKWIARGPENDTEERPGLAWAHDSRFDHYGNFEDMAEDITNAKKDADIVIVSLHFGWEYDLYPDQGPSDGQAQKRCAQAAIDAGASVVFGHHPHVVQWLDEDPKTGVEEYNGGYIAYSLGNFIFDISSEHPEAPNGEATRGLILEVIIENKQIIELNQIETVYYDNLWQTHIVGAVGE